MEDLREANIVSLLEVMGHGGVMHFDLSNDGMALVAAEQLRRCIFPDAKADPAFKNLAIPVPLPST